MTGRSFDLVDQPWIPVRRLDGSDVEVSLRTALTEAHLLVAVTGELPTTAAALLRLLVVILRRATAQRAGHAVDRWGDLWAAPRLPLEDLDSYLTRTHDRFDLWHPTTPFLQVPDLRTVSGLTSSLLPLIADVPNNDQFFTTRAGTGTALITDAEAARWLVHCHAFDPSGIKSGAVGDEDRVKGGKGYPIGTSWAGQLGLVIVEGPTLKDTLLLNLPMQTRNGESWPSDDLPVWERPQLSAAPDPSAHAQPALCELLTWTGRRIRLVPAADDQVSGVLICNGDRITPRDQFAEPMAAWRRSTPQERALGRSPVYMPLTHSPQRALWRGMAALLPLVPTAASDGADRLEPLNLRWIRAVQHDGEILPPDFVLRTRAVGVVYGSNSSVVAEIIDDAVIVQAVLLGGHGQELRQLAVTAVADADAVGLAVGRLAGNLVTASGGEADAARANGRERFFLAVDRDYRHWLAGLGADTEPGQARVAWQKILDRRARDFEEELLRDAGPAAWVGRSVRTNNKDQWYDAGLVSRWFRTQLRAALNTVYPPTSEPQLSLDRTTQETS